MKANTVLKDQSYTYNSRLVELTEALNKITPKISWIFCPNGQVLEIEAYKMQRIEKTLNSVVYVKGRANVLIKELFSPLNSAAVVIRRRDGSYLDPCDFGSYLYQNKTDGCQR